MNLIGKPTALHIKIDDSSLISKNIGLLSFMIRSNDDNFFGFIIRIEF